MENIIIQRSQTPKEEPLPINMIYFNGQTEELFKTIDSHSTRYAVFVVDFFANWCAPCRRLGAVLPDIAAKHPHVMFIKINVEENRNLSNDFNVHILPTIKIFASQSGSIREISTIRGFNPKAITSQCEEYQKMYIPFVIIYDCNWTYENPPKST